MPQLQTVGDQPSAACCRCTFQRRSPRRDSSQKISEPGGCTAVRRIVHASRYRLRRRYALPCHVTAHASALLNYNAAERVLCYLVRHRKVGRRYTPDDGFARGFSDSDWAVRRSTTGWVYMLSCAAISWCSKRQDSVALSLCARRKLLRHLTRVRRPYTSLALLPSSACGIPRQSTCHLITRALLT